MNASKRYRYATLIVLLGTLVLAACGTSTLRHLDEDKVSSGKKDFVALAQQDISCKPTDSGCNQRHLIKGDACFRLAKQADGTKDRFLCAVDHLGLGIQQTSNWREGEIDLNRAQTHENLLESLRLLQDMERGQEATARARQLMEQAKTFLSVEPGNLAGIYFLSSARLSLLQPQLFLTPVPTQVCGEFKSILTDLQGAEPRASGTRYEPNYRQLILDVSGTRAAVPACE